MLSIGEFSRVCGVTSRTLRYYDKINLIKPSHIDIASGYRFYDLGQLRQMLFINRLKSYVTVFAWMAPSIPLRMESAASGQPI